MLLNTITPAEAVNFVSSGQRVFFQGAAMTPNLLINALCQRHQDLKDVEIIQVHTEGVALYTQEPYNKQTLIHI